MRVSLLFFVMSLLAFVGCKSQEVTPDDTDGWHPDHDNYYDHDDDFPEYDQPDKEVGPQCKLDDTFFDGIVRAKMLPAEWNSFFTMKIMGLINGPQDDLQYAFLIKAHATLKGTDYNLGSSYGVYIRDIVTNVFGEKFPVIVATGVGNPTYPIANKILSLWMVQTATAVDDLMVWKKQARIENMTGVDIHGTYLVSIFERWIEYTSYPRYLRMECVRGLSAVDEYNTGYDGAMFFCVDKNTEWAVGETMKMMDYSRMLDQDADILAVLNEGLTPEDPDYRTDVCRCYTRDVDMRGNPTTIMDCEEMKKEVNDGALPDNDTVPDDDATTSDDDVLIEKCGNGILETGEECDAGMSIPCVEIDPVQFSTGDAPCMDDCLGWDVAACVEQNSGKDDE